MMLEDFRNEKFDIVIQAGQSNSEGCGLGPTNEPYVESNDILYFLNDFSICIASEWIAGTEISANFSLPFCTRYIADGRLASGRKLLVIRAAIGGTGFLDNHWKLEDDLFLRMMEMIRTALSLNAGNKLVAFLWHQGETDAMLGADYQTHYNHLRTLLDTVRNSYQVPELPFIAGDFVYHWKLENLAACEPVILAMKDVCDKAGSAKFIETEGLESNDQKIGNGDTIHFCREAIKLLGARYYEAFCEIAGK